MFFVHPQIESSSENLKKVFFSFSKKTDFSFLREKLSFYFPEKKIVFTDMARSAFKIIIEKLNLRNSEVIVPAYICDIFYPIFKKYNIKPIFVDINLETFNVDVAELLSKISPDTKAILIVHTYGLLAEIERIKKTVNIPIIEDCAHSFGLRKGDGFSGNTGDAAFFSIYKQFPTQRGGFLVYPKEWDVRLKETKFSFRDFISFLNSFSVFAFLFKTFAKDVAPKFVRKEKGVEPSSLNRVSLNFFSYFLKDFQRKLEKRISLALFFQEELRKIGFETQNSNNNVFCYVSALIPKEMREKRDRLVEELRKEKVFCTRIWHTPIIKNPEVKKEYNINLNEFPNAIEAAERIINFPLQNHYTKNDIIKMVESIKKIQSKL